MSVGCASCVVPVNGETLFRGSISFGECNALIFCPCDMVVEELSVQFALESAGKAGCSTSLCFVFERACSVRGKRSELYVVVSEVCGINWKITVSIANFDIKRLFSICFYTFAFALPNRNPTISVHCRCQPILSFCFGSTVLWISTHVRCKSVPGFVF